MEVFISQVRKFNVMHSSSRTYLRVHAGSATDEQGQSPAATTAEPDIGVPRYHPYLAIKYIVETLAGVVLLILFAPVILAAAVLVVLTSRGPAFYCQTRLGKLGRQFTVYKLRSMIQGAEATTGATWCQINDNRITPLGRILRDTHLDELPQLVNVVLGHMSLVGPRPERPELADQLQAQLPRFHERLKVRPGITGFAQLRLPADTDMDCVRRKLAYDLYYVRNLNPWLDFRILVLTFQLFAMSLAASLLNSMALPSREAIETRFIPVSGGDPDAIYVNDPLRSFSPEQRLPLSRHETQPV
jgi:lipopolysaccharide/colanic/teichoic acid biosynthesis glycosyltransferase